MKRTPLGPLSAAALVLSLTCGWAQADNPLKLLPTPKVLKVDGGSMPLTAESRIVATDPKLKPLADILADEILLVTKLRPAVVAGEGKAGDIVLTINPKLQADADILTVHGQEVLKTREYAHTIAVTDRVAIEGWDYRAVCEGTSTLLQAIAIEGEKASVPKMTIKDWPYSDFGAIMVDCARQPQPIYVLKMAAEICRLFRIRYLHLHLTEDNGYTFPSTAYPEANSVHYPPLTPYTLAELKDLVAYADARGVTCVPELEGPGHSTALLDSMKGRLGKPGSNYPTDQFLPTTFPILDTLVGEMCDVFKSSPYFHIGGDEVGTGLLGDPRYVQYMKEHNMSGESAVWIVYAQKMTEIVKKHGKKTLMWDGMPVGCPLDKSLAKDVILYTWFPAKGRSRAAQDMGYTTVTVPWNMPPFEQFSLFTCNDDVLTPKDKILGHCRPMWEMDHVALANAYLPGAPERHERTWGPDNVIEPDYHKNRLARQNVRVNMIVRPVTLTYGGAIKDGLFSDPITVTMSTIVPGGQIRYRLDGKEPTAESPLYDKPFTVTESLRIRAALFDKDGKRLGNITVGDGYQYVNRQTNLTTGKPVTASHPFQREDKPEMAVDGEVRLDRYWACGTTPSWLQIDLQNVHTLDRVQVFPYWDDVRYYQYTIELSTDGKTWKRVADASANTAPETEKGRLHKFDPTPARYVRVNVLKNSDNYAAHLVEVRAWEAGK
ncbi:MAG: family 20 glycosylhydrolase [Planctomycetota bacterium]|nr:family 20 glycosylhydrolase [Planctomycetota bacterium]